jgi:putative glutamine amidotransferase
VNGADADDPAVFLYTSYIRALEQVGLATVLVTPVHSMGTVDSLVGACCGLVLTGGEDVEPWRYGEVPSPALGQTEPARDAMEFRAIGTALALGVPILGICRGAQVLNVHFGGTLYQDIDTERPGPLLHEQPQPWCERTHEVDILRDSLLHTVTGERRLFINSFHHQAVKQPAPDLRVSARADDGLIEAIEHVDHPWLLGVQWHPERNEATAPAAAPDHRIFVAFRDAVLRHAGC